MLELARSTISTESWKGYNHNLRIDEAESWDEKNMSADEYPVLSPRRARTECAAPASCQGLIEKDALSMLGFDAPEYENVTLSNLIPLSILDASRLPFSNDGFLPRTRDILSADVFALSA